MYNDGQNWNHKSRSRKSENFSKPWQFNYQIFSCGLTKKMNTHTLCFRPLIRKLQAFEILKWVQGSQWRSRGHPISPVKYNLNFHCSENTAFYIFTAMKYSFFKICIIFIQYFSVFHYFVYNKRYYYTSREFPIQNFHRRTADIL